MFTTSAVEDHVHTAYDIQAAGFVTKPTSYRGLVDAVPGIDRYWLTTVTTPNTPPQLKETRQPSEGSSESGAENCSPES